MSNTILFYSSPGCASCRKAKRWLEENHITYVEKNIFSNLLTDEEIRYLMTRCDNGTDDIISTRSKAYNMIKGKMDDLSLPELAHFIQKNPSILKRPIMISDRNLVIGYDDDEITSMIPRKHRQEQAAHFDPHPASIKVIRE